MQDSKKVILAGVIIFILAVLALAIFYFFISDSTEDATFVGELSKDKPAHVSESKGDIGLNRLNG